MSHDLKILLAGFCLFILFVVFFGGCQPPYYAGTAAPHISTIPCNKDNCGQAPAWQ